MNWLSALDVALLLRLIVAHIVVDYLVVPGVRTRGSAFDRTTLRGAIEHGLVSAVVAYVFAARWTSWWLALVVLVGHVVSDLVNARSTPRPAVGALDQLGHLLLLTGCWLLLSGIGLSTLGGSLSRLFGDPTAWALVLAYATVILPAGWAVGAFTARWSSGLDHGKDCRDGLAEGGLWIGRLERVLVVTFILLNHFEAIGFLVAAKSILRYGEVSRGASRREAEYVLVGTMMSFIVAILVGVLAAWFISM
jgi:hypothetical protein